MIYSVLPPILVVLSLAGIIFFLVKKAPDVALLSNGEASGTGGRESGASLRRFFRKKAEAREGAERKKISHTLLIFLEKITVRFRLMFLKLEHLFTRWSQSIRQKRNRRIEDEKNVLEKTTEKQDILEKITQHRSEEEGDIKARRSFDFQEPKEKPIKPMISDKVVVPQIEIKDRLEKILIERIASNPKDIEAYERLGEYYFEIGNYDHSKECFKQVLKLNPTNSSVRYRMRKLERLLMR